MIPVKVQCGCGQKYAFEVDPVDGHMPMPVKCPACGGDGTRMANEFIARALGAQPAVATPAQPVAAVAVAAAPVPPTRASAIRLTPSVAAAKPPPMPAPSPLPMSRPLPTPKPSRGKDGWDTEETQLNKLGSWVMIGPVILAALFSSGMFGVQLSGTLLATVVAIGGVVGGMLNIAGRGPILAGAFVGLVMALGGYVAIYWWIQGRESVRKFEIIIAMVVGMLPGFLLQMGLQALLRKRARS
jgi:hypothetical protein